MARAPIEIAIASETKAFRQGVESGIIRPLEDSEKALDELGRARGAEQLEQSMKDAQRQTKELADETKKTAREIEDEFRDSYRKVGDASRAAGDAGADGMGRVREGAGEVSSELAGNLGEAVSSFRGDMSDLDQIGQDTFGGLAATIGGMGPAGFVGALVLAAGAAGLGAVVGGIEQAKEEQEELNEAAADWARAYQDSAGKIISATYIVSEIQRLGADPEAQKQVTEAVKEWGVEADIVLRAMAGDLTAVEIVRRSLNEREVESIALLKEQEQQVDQNAGAAYDLADAVAAGRERFDKLTNSMSIGEGYAKNAAKALFGYAEAAGEATGRTDSLGRKIVELPDGKEVVVDAKTKAAYDEFEELEGRTLKRKEIVAKMKIDDSELLAYIPPTIRIPGRIVPRGVDQIV